MPPSAASSTASTVASSRASASAAAFSAAARATEFEASVRRRGRPGRHRRIREPAPEPERRTARALVTITNKTNQKSSYAMQVDFTDSAGKVVDTGFLGAGKPEPGHKKEPIAFSGQPQGTH